MKQAIEVIPLPGKLSHPAGVRGLKLDKDRQLKAVLPVAPRRGAWIET